MSIYNEVFQRCYQELAEIVTASVRQDYERRRYNRALLALRSQNYFFGSVFTNVSGAAGVTGRTRTLALEQPVIIRGGGMNTYFIGVGGSDHIEVPTGGAVNVKVTRSGSSRAQISKEQIRSSHYFSAGEAQPWELDWPVPWRLDPNEIIAVDWTQESAVDANTIYNLNFYGVVVDPKLRCDDNVLADVRQQVRDVQIQRPRYLHLKTDKGAGTIVFPASDGTQQRATANTIEAPEHLLIIGFRRWQLAFGPHIGTPLQSTARLVVTGGKAFSRVEVPVNAFENFNAPGSGFFRLAIPHFVPKGTSLSLSVTTTPEEDNLADQYEGEVELLCVTV